MSSIAFKHTMAAHCETGTITALLNHAGLKITEPMIFGVAGGIFFAYLDTSKFTFPQFVMRSKPGDIRKKTEKRLGIRFAGVKFGKAEKARVALDDLLQQNIPVAVQVDMFYMDYIPQYMKAHFNGHFITVVGKDDAEYLVSDCYYPSVARLPLASMDSGRFAKGDLAPRGFQFFPITMPGEINWHKAIRDGMKQAAFFMTGLPIPFLGVKGIRLFGRKVVGWPKLTRNIEHLSHEIMMIHVTLEERGTGGAGFRFMYATFLQEAATVLSMPPLADLARRMMENGDKWREISLFVARIGKNRELGENRLRELQEMIMARADWEEKFFRELGSVARGMRIEFRSQ